jgi:2'-5' RNA ligase
MGLIRCFIGLPLPEAYKTQLSGLLATLKYQVPARVSWTRPENWHLTLKFLGETAPETVAAVKAALAGVRAPAFALKAGGCGFFPDLRRPRVVWLGLVQGAAQCAALARAVEGAVALHGFPPEGRPFAARLTLGRIKDAAGKPGGQRGGPSGGPSGGPPGGPSVGQDWAKLQALAARVEWPEARMDRFVLWESRLHPGGPEYVALAEYPFF